LQRLKSSWQPAIGKKKEKSNDAAMDPLTGVCTYQWVDVPLSSGSTAGL
jgi:hypothetical protein